ncbi:GFA family protein [Spartinivicinus poritis]|uniref:GFA family protein n=1 Tax=Spartinivicinus poritis TaxID=2994640 RepID=A0ABT5UHM2_9GAMM|nr:GFA family protein [Spartinivicinus sp. A2-2]MDE1465896.1 GFA family protein [Spartinivicinus sp. A2-2]
MLLEGSCHCGSVKFTVSSAYPYPFNLCYCSVCRKTAGGGGFAINLSGRYETLIIEGKEHTSIYHAIIDGKESPAERHFCKHCASALWVYDSRWPELVHPFASAIDSELPIPPERTHLMLRSKSSWVEVEKKPNDKCFSEYPEESIAQWHKRLSLEK